MQYDFKDTLWNPEAKEAESLVKMARHDFPIISIIGEMILFAEKEKRAAEEEAEHIYWQGRADGLRAARLFVLDHDGEPNDLGASIILTSRSEYQPESDRELAELLKNRKRK